MDTDIPILVCATEPDPRVRALGLPIFEDHCAECATKVVHSGDPGVPKDAIKLCFICAQKRVQESEEVPEIKITEQNMEVMGKLGYRFKPVGSC